MGCCFSGEEQAAETDQPPPTWGQAINVQLTKQGMLDADFDVFDLNKTVDEGKVRAALCLLAPQRPDLLPHTCSSRARSQTRSPWMLMDMVGKLFDPDWTFYLKHRMTGQEESSSLGVAALVYPLLEYQVRSLGWPVPRVRPSVHRHANGGALSASHDAARNKFEIRKFTASGRR